MKHKCVQMQPSLYLPNFDPCDFFSFLYWKLIAKTMFEDIKDMKKKVLQHSFTSYQTKSFDQSKTSWNKSVEC